MSNRGIEAVLVVGHGSRREEANDDVREAARRISERGGFPFVVAAFLEIVNPNIDEGFAQLVELGARHITVHPYFLSPGRHTRGDIPIEVRNAASRHPGVSYQISEPLTAHPSVIDASIERIRETQRPAAESTSSCQAGKVYLVGAGPGDPGLLTVRALDLLRRADVVVYDYLVNPDVLVNVRPNAERIYAGKVGGGRQTPQDEINRMLVDRAREGNLVVRLKGGDPFLFGRGGEEGKALRAAGIPFEFVPGVSSALAVPAYAGIPLTHRGIARSVTIVTGVQAEDGEISAELKHAAHANTLVILMGLSNIRRIAEELLNAGRAANTPVAVIRWGTHETQETVTGSLLEIADLVQSKSLRPPAVIVVGEVVHLREELKWFEESLGRQTNDDSLAAVHAGA
jgi:uroporphyrin-III C-methyltransferase